MIEPGPSQITADEHAIAEDPANGIEHAVILLEETERNESFRVSNLVTYHQRAKVLSNEGRSLADITIPYDMDDSKLKRWWGRTILPDGEVLELTQDQLEQQFVAGTRNEEIIVLRGTLPGVIPGAVIDYGYEIKGKGLLPSEPVELQRDHVVKRFRFRWVPWDGLASAFFVLGRSDIKVETERQDRAILVDAENVPAAINEPYMPPASATKTSLYLYYTAARGGVDEFWKAEAESWHSLTETFSGSRRARKKIIEAMEVPQDADLDTQLRYVYDWMEQNLESTYLRTSEQRAQAAEDEDLPDTCKQLMAEGTGTSVALDLHFIAIARELGAAADIVLAPDRTKLIWVRHLMTSDQLPKRFVAVHMPDTPEDQLIFVDPGSTLPYGMVPWWASGISGMMATEDGDRAVMIPGSSPGRNISRTNAELSFIEDNEIVEATWTRAGQGQNGYLDKLRLRWRKPEKREQYLRDLCGESAEMEIIEATAPALDDAREDLKIACSAEQMLPLVDEEAEAIRYQIDGPWFIEPPDLPAGDRFHPIIFDYPRTDITMLHISAPEGYRATMTPAPIKIESQLGSYQLTIVPDDTGYRIVRGLSQHALMVNPDGYESLQSHLAEVRKADRTALVFTRVEEEP